jgi:hypothetical protein
MVEVSRSFGRKFGCDPQGLIDDSSPPWWIKLAADLTGGQWDYRKLSYSLMDLDGGGAVRRLWDIRRGQPFKLPWGVFCKPRTWIKMMFTEEGIHKNSMRFQRKGIDIPLIPGVTLV